MLKEKQVKNDRNDDICSWQIMWVQKPAIKALSANKTTAITYDSALAIKQINPESKAIKPEPEINTIKNELKSNQPIKIKDLPNPRQHSHPLIK